MFPLYTIFTNSVTFEIITWELCLLNILFGYEYPVKKNDDPVFTVDPWATPELAATTSYAVANLSVTFDFLKTCPSVSVGDWF